MSQAEDRFHVLRCVDLVLQRVESNLFPDEELNE